MERLTNRKTKLAKCGSEPSMIDVVHKLAEYEDLEEQGKLLKLPCAVGDKIYYLTGTPNSLGNGEFDRVEESKAIGFYADRDRIMIQLDYNWRGNHGTYGFFGKTVFLTREEAEAALEEMGK